MTGRADRRLLLPLVLAASLAPSGCGTIACLVPLEAGRFGIPKKGEPVLDPYGGVRRDVRIIEDGFWPFALDVPLSFALDTLVLPITCLAWLIDLPGAPGPNEPSPRSPEPPPVPRAEPPRLVVDQVLEARFDGASSRSFTASLHAPSHYAEASRRSYVVEVRAAPGVLDRLWLGRGSGATWVRAPADGGDVLRAVVDTCRSEQLTLEVWPAGPTSQPFTVSVQNR